jgi:uracil phosphoribosyltransferase
MTYILTHTNSIGNQFLAEMRDETIQKDPQRFRRNQERLGEIFAYEISKNLEYHTTDIQTPLGTATANVLLEQPVLTTILRAGLPFHQGFLNFFDKAPSAFAIAYRKVKKSGDFIIHVEHISTPDLNNRIVILCDAMLATGQSMVKIAKELLARFNIRELHIASIIASTEGIEHVRANIPQAKLWIGAVDEELTIKAYIVPGLGDAGDLSYGEKTD